MSDDQKDAIGRVIREKKEAEQQRDLLLAEAREFGQLFPALKASLNASPEYVVFECQLRSVDVRYYAPAGNNRVYKSDEVNSERLIALTNDIRSTLLRIADLTEQASRLGF